MLGYNLNPYDLKIEPPNGGGLPFDNIKLDVSLSDIGITPKDVFNANFDTTNFNTTSLVGIGTQLLQPSGFDNLIDSLGLGSLFGQTSFETISAEGGQIVKNAMDRLQRDLKTNPSQAMSDYSKTLNKESIRFHLMILNATSRRTTQGLPISKKAIDEAIKNIPTIERELKKVFKMSKQSQTDTFHFKKTLPYTWYKYTLTPQSSSAVASLPDSKFVATGGNQPVPNAAKPKTKFPTWLKWTLIAVAPLGLLGYGIYKLIKK